MGFFSKAYEPGGRHHIRITDDSFAKANKLVKEDSEYKEIYKTIAKDNECLQYQAHDFPVIEILGSFMLSYHLEEERLGIPENLRAANIELGRKDQVEFSKFVDRFNEKIDAKADRKQAAWEEKGIGGKLFSMAAGVAVKGIAAVATGKSEDLRTYEKFFSDYISGDSPKAKEYIHQFAIQFGPSDEGVLAVSNAIRRSYWMAEFAKYNRS
ncbi:hypothetical protein [Geobacter sp. AOG2]|uniref:hypothetical protein n=1 Tax=Geobacter sp. AOG2 TaxID=1566347 RepID=UPI001CC6472F|nr:hypothetical protein [Geobacter sp. AOG2]GFE62863.1 hypothetical protein AOG2_34520 [Geobacter sp. AOG2]